MMNNSIEIYSSQDGSIQLNVKLENDTVWLTQSQMAELFGVDRTSIVRHIRNIYKSEENLIKIQPVQKMHRFEQKEIVVFFVKFLITTWI